MHVPILLLLLQSQNSRHDELTNKELIYNWNKKLTYHMPNKNATIQIYTIELKVDHHTPKQKSYWTKWFHEDIMESNTHQYQDDRRINITSEANVLKTPCHLETTSWLKVSWHSPMSWRLVWQEQIFGLTIK